MPKQPVAPKTDVLAKGPLRAEPKPASSTVGGADYLKLMQSTSGLMAQRQILKPRATPAGGGPGQNPSSASPLLEASLGLDSTRRLPGTGRNWTKKKGVQSDRSPLQKTSMSVGVDHTWNSGSTALKRFGDEKNRADLGHADWALNTGYALEVEGAKRQHHLDAVRAEGSVAAFELKGEREIASIGL